MHNDWLYKGFSRPRQTIAYPTIILAKDNLKVKNFCN